MRDFVSVHDIVQANVLAMEKPSADGMALNIGSGQPITISDIAGELASALKCNVPVEITDKYRAGDIRHCFADITAANMVLNYQPKVRLRDGMRELVEWLEDQEADDHVDEAMQRLSVHGLVA
jgi:dTDP-L-rhamnose 4-epimerase